MKLRVITRHANSFQRKKIRKIYSISHKQLIENRVRRRKKKAIKKLTFFWFEKWNGILISVEPAFHTTLNQWQWANMPWTSL